MTDDSLAPLRVLVVEDYEDCADSTAAFLQLLGGTG